MLKTAYAQQAKPGHPPGLAGFRYLTWREARNTGFLRLIETIDDQRYVRKTGLCFSSSHCSGRAQVRIPAAGDCRLRFLLQAR
jgi:hypothetical protein